VGALAYAALYALVASQQFTHYAHPAGMSLTMAGIVPQEAVAILVRALRPVIVTTNAILLLFHVAAGFAVGWSAGRFWDEVRGRGGRAHAGWRRLAFVGGSLVAVAALAFTRTVVRYPFQYDHLLNAQGGSLRRLEQFLTSHLHPDLLDLSMGALIGCLALPAVVRAARRRPLAAATLVGAALGVAAWRSPAPAAGFNEGPNVVLILV